MYMHICFSLKELPMPVLRLSIISKVLAKMRTPSLYIFYETLNSWRRRLTCYLQARRREAEEEIGTDEEEVQQFLI